MPNRSKANATKRFSAVIAGVLIFATSSGPIAAKNVTKSTFVVKDSRNIGANPVRVAAAQGTKNKPNIALFGGNPKIWPKIRNAVIEAEAMGYPVRAILVGPASEKPSLEIYANGQHVTRSIDPNRISKQALVTLIKDIHKRFYKT